MGEILGDVLSGKLPFNVANSVANFLALVRQIIETYAAQQQYQQSGPGRYYSAAYRNVTTLYFTNPSPSQSDGGEPITSGPSSKKSSSNSYSRNNEEIAILKKEIQDLKRQVELLRRQ